MLQTKKIKIAFGILFVIYLVTLLYFLFFAEMMGRTEHTALNQEFAYNLIPFHEITRFVKYADKVGIASVCLNLGGNVLAFAPFGFALPVLWKKMRSCLKTTGVTMLFSLLIETTQLISKVGIFDVDDIILNTAGGLIGYLMFCVCFRVIWKRLGHSATESAGDGEK